MPDQRDYKRCYNMMGPEAIERKRFTQRTTRFLVLKRLPCPIFFLPDDPGGRRRSQRSSYGCRSSYFLLVVISNYSHCGNGSSRFHGFAMEVLWLLRPSHLCPNLSPEAGMMLSPQGKNDQLRSVFHGVQRQIFSQLHLLHLWPTSFLGCSGHSKWLHTESSA